jgi:hypothetical protein
VHPAVLWLGFAAGGGVPGPGRWIGPATAVDTPAGPCPAARLRPGDVVVTPAGPRPLAAAERLPGPAAGRFAPVRLRAPWFARQADLIVSPEMPLRLSGVAVEYLFGAEAVLARAADLAGGRAAHGAPSAAPVQGVALRLPPDPRPGAQVVLAGGCALSLDPDAACLPAVEAVPLRLLLGAGMPRAA